MADPLCKVMDVNGVVPLDSKSLPAAGTKRAVAKVCFDPATLEVSSATRVQLSSEEIRQIQSDFAHRQERDVQRRQSVLGPAHIISTIPPGSLESTRKLDVPPPGPNDPKPIRGGKGTLGEKK